MALEKIEEAKELLKKIRPPEDHGECLETSTLYDILNELKVEFKIDRVESYYYFSGRNSTTYVETTFWYNPITLDRKETTRSHSCYDAESYRRPDWAKSITTRNKSLDCSNY